MIDAILHCIGCVCVALFYISIAAALICAIDFLVWKMKKRRYNK